MMNEPSTKCAVLNLNPFYGLIYAGIAVILLVAMLIVPKQLVFRSNHQATKLPLLQQPISLNMFTCTFKKITGLPCATCGGTRSTFYLSHLQLKQSLLINPMVFLGFVGLLTWGIISLISIAFYKSKAMTLLLPGKRLLIILLVGGLLVNWAYLIFISKP
ncbi:MAG: DUF2752 domain-containing protein [Planctomycetes bacterium]|nr:DUF2752 domain-containing protein [Planctomycetota bacterium]